MNRHNQHDLFQNSNIVLMRLCLHQKKSPRGMIQRGLLLRKVKASECGERIQTWLRRVRPPGALTPIRENSDLGIYQGQTQVSAKACAFGVENFFLPHPILATLLLTPTALCTFNKACFSTLSCLGSLNSKGVLPPAVSTAPNGPLQPDAFAGKGGGRGGRRRREE